MSKVASPRPRAIDLYSGVGGWSLGLTLADIEVVASYEKWGAANETNFKNNAHQAQTVDIRRLSLADLPTDIDFVVGSPPCTQFSYSNRGGSGDISDGLQDIKCFLRIVDHLKPRFWVMENVPRVAKILKQELKPDGALAEFTHLGCVPHVVDMARFGLPQKRRRCIAGNFDIALLNSYQGALADRTLGDVVTALSTDPILDPIYGFEIERRRVVDHVEEDLLTEEEVRINRANKTLHPVYNGMPFPDPLDRPVRTITATCTRVSRESIIIESPERRLEYRRLTIRERASLQGFPVDFQFYGTNYGQKLRMVGNAVPPHFAYFVGNCLQERSVEQLRPISEVARDWRGPEPLPVQTRPERSGSKFPTKRTFRFSIPSLHLKSGVRFDLTNLFEGDTVRWRVVFYFGNPKAIQSVDLNGELADFLFRRLSEELREELDDLILEVEDLVRRTDVANLQTVWTHRGPGGTRPFIMLDELDRKAATVVEIFQQHEAEAESLLQTVIDRQYGHGTVPIGYGKLRRKAAIIVAGLLVGSAANRFLDERASELAIAEQKGRA